MSLRISSALLFFASVALVTTLGNAQSKSANGDGGPAIEATINGPSAISVDKSGNLYILELLASRVRMVDAKTGVIQTIAGNGLECCFEESKDARSSAFFGPDSIAIDHDGDIYVAEVLAHIRRIAATTGIGTTVVSTLVGKGADKPGIAPSLPTYERVEGLAIDATDTLYVAGGSSGKIYTISHGVVSVFAGVGGHGFKGDGKPASEAQFNWPMGIAFDPAGDLIIADYENCRIRRIDKVSNLVSTIAGTGECRSGSSGGRGTETPIDRPSNVAVDSTGNIYFNDASPACVRKIDAKTMSISSVPGTCEPKAGKTGRPSGLAVDKEGNLFVSEIGSNVVLRIDAKTGAVTTVAGNGLPDRIDIML
jgi:DNA-binding beta-propeller fold protein YncE